MNSESFVYYLTDAFRILRENGLKTLLDPLNAFGTAHAMLAQISLRETCTWTGRTKDS